MLFQGCFSCFFSVFFSLDSVLFLELLTWLESKLTLIFVKRWLELSSVLFLVKLALLIFFMLKSLFLLPDLSFLVFLIWIDWIYWLGSEVCFVRIGLFIYMSRNSFCYETWRSFWSSWCVWYIIDSFRSFGYSVWLLWRILDWLNMLLSSGVLYLSSNLRCLIIFFLSITFFYSN